MDIIIPVYNEKDNIINVLKSLQEKVRSPFRVLICYDYEEDNTLPIVKEFSINTGLKVDFIKNKYTGVHGAIRSGFDDSSAGAVLVYMADDDYNAGMIDDMRQIIEQGYDIVVPSRFMKGGKVEGAPFIKLWFVRVASLTLHLLAQVPVQDTTNGFRMFSKRIIKDIEIESTEGFTYSIELLVKCHRLGWKIAEVPALWFERKSGKSRFNFSKWLPHYLKWYYYAFATTFLKKSKDSVRFKLNKSKFMQNLYKKNITSSVVEKCQICGNAELKNIVFLGYFFPPSKVNKIKDLPSEETAYPLQLLFCHKCFLVQSGLMVNKEILFPPEFPYTAGTNKILADNFTQLYEESKDIIGLRQEDLVIDIGSNDGTLLSNFKDYCKVLGITPEEIGKMAIEKDIPTIIDYFNEKVVDKIIQEIGKAKLITATNVFAHMENLEEVMQNILKLLDENGVFVSESQYLFALINKLQYDTIYHEHLRYYSLHSLKYLFEMYGMEIFYVKEINPHGGSIRVYAARAGKYVIKKEVEELLQKEKGVVTSYDELLKFKNRMVISKLELHSKLLEIKKMGCKIYGIGAAARATTLINYVGLDEGILDCILEVNGSQKVGNYMTGTLIPIYDESLLYQDQPEYAMLLSWHLAEILIPKFKENGFNGKFIIPLPEPKIIE